MNVVVASSDKVEIFSCKSVEAAVRHLYENVTIVKCMHRLDNEGDLRDYIEMYANTGYEIIDHRKPDECSSQGTRSHFHKEVQEMFCDLHNNI